MNRTLWNNGWKFTDPSGALAAKVVDLPHDAMLLEKRVPNLVSGSATGYFPGGRYIYEKVLTLTEEQAAQTVILEFEGIYQKSKVWLNDQEIGGRIYGYSDFLLDLTGKVHAGENRIRVEADNSQIPNSRWYTGSGIYRDVWLWTSGKEYIKPYGVKLTTKSIKPAVLSVAVDACCEANAACRIVVSKDGAKVSETTVAGSNGCFGAELEIPEAKLWTAETPELYDVEVELIREDAVIDATSQRTGLRTLVWSAKNGFQVNGKTVKFRGGCVHHDHGPLGAKSFKDAELHRARIMKEAGFNAVRYAHNPAGSAFLEACDEVGLYVMDETFDTWFGPKSEFDYGLYFDEEHIGDLKDMIRMAYNHPSVVMYCIGNEIQLKDLDETVPLTKEMVGVCHEEDPTRPVLNSMNLLLSNASAKRGDPNKKNEPGDPRRVGDGGGRSSNITGSFLFNILSTHFSKIVKLAVNEKGIRKINGVMEPLDIVGFNYGDFLYEEHHKDYPDRVLMGSETYPKEIYAYWDQVKKHPYVVGDFTWTAWDYLGEAGVGAPAYGQGPAFTRPYPCISAGCSNIDLTGHIKSQGDYFRVVYGLERKPRLAVHPVTHSGEKLALGSWALTHAMHSWSWNGCEGKTAAVDVYADAAAVELFLNGVSLGRKIPKEYIASYELPYAAGELKAVSYDGTGKIIGEDVLRSAEKDTVLRLSPEKAEVYADRQSLLYVDIDFCDENGIVKSSVDQQIDVRVSGAAELVGLCSSNPFTEDNYTSGACHTYYGRAVAVLRATGEIGEIMIEVKAHNGLCGCATVSAAK